MKKYRIKYKKGDNIILKIFKPIIMKKRFIFFIWMIEMQIFWKLRR